MTALRVYPLPRLMSSASDTRSGQIFKALCAVYPGRISAGHLMGRSGLSWRAEPIISFVCLCNDFIQINKAIAPFGWQAMRSDGTPLADYWLAPRGGA